MRDLDVGAIITYHRHNMQWTREELADRSGVSPRTLTNIATNSRQPSDDVIAQVVEVLIPADHPDRRSIARALLRRASPRLYALAQIDERPARLSKNRHAKAAQVGG